MDIEAQETAPEAARTLHTFLARLGVAFDSDVQLAELVREGLPLEAAAVLRAWGVTPQELDTLVIPRRTLIHRQKDRQRLTPMESDRALRLVRIIAHAEETFGDREKADLWLRRPTPALGGEAPLALADTQPGSDAVEHLLVRMHHGIAA